jgi:hypothetical protein
MQRRLIIGSFVLLVSGLLLYREDTLFPLLLPALVVISWSLFVFTLRCLQLCLTASSTSSSATGTGMAAANNGTIIKRRDSSKSLQQQASSTSSSEQQQQQQQQQVGEVPTAYLKQHRNDPEKARIAFNNTRVWRNKNNIDTMITVVNTNRQQQQHHHQHHQEVMGLYPHFIHGVSKDGVVVLYEVCISSCCC